MFTTTEIIERLKVLWRKLEDDGRYVSGNTILLAIIRLEELSKPMRVGERVTISGCPEPMDGEFVIEAVSNRYLGGKTAAATKPWEAQGISRRTWYRRKKEQKK